MLFGAYVNNDFDLNKSPHINLPNHDPNDQCNEDLASDLTCDVTPSKRHIIVTKLKNYYVCIT